MAGTVVGKGRASAVESCYSYFPTTSTNAVAAAKIKNSNSAALR
jgi:hypothetical protein